MSASRIGPLQFQVDDLGPWEATEILPEPVVPPVLQRWVSTREWLPYGGADTNPLDPQGHWAFGQEWIDDPNPNAGGPFGSGSAGWDPGLPVRGGSGGSGGGGGGRPSPPCVQEPARWENTTDSEKKFIRDTLCAILTLNPCIRLFSGLRECLLSAWQKCTVILVDHGAYPCNYDTDCGHWNLISNELRICRRRLKDRESLFSCMLHELLHGCGITEFEAEVIENICGGKGATPPGKHDNDFEDALPSQLNPDYPVHLERFVDTTQSPPKLLFRGRWFAWDCVTGAVYRVVDNRIDYANPVFPAGGIFTPPVIPLLCK